MKTILDLYNNLNQITLKKDAAFPTKSLVDAITEENENHLSPSNFWRPIQKFTDCFFVEYRQSLHLLNLHEQVEQTARLIDLSLKQAKAPFSRRAELLQKHQRASDALKAMSAARKQHVATKVIVTSAALLTSLALQSEKPLLYTLTAYWLTLTVTSHTQTENNSLYFQSLKDWSNAVKPYLHEIELTSKAQDQHEPVQLTYSKLTGSEKQNIYDSINQAYAASLDGHKDQRYDNFQAFEKSIESSESHPAKEETWFAIPSSEANNYSAGVIYKNNPEFILANTAAYPFKDGDGSTYAYYGTLWVSPENRGKGLASKLIKAMEQTARDRNKRYIAMYVSSQQPSLQAIYLNKGYVDTGIKSPSGNFCIFEKDLEV